MGEKTQWTTSHVLSHLQPSTTHTAEHDASSRDGAKLTVVKRGSNSQHFAGGYAEERMTQSSQQHMKPVFAAKALRLPNQRVGTMLSRYVIAYLVVAAARTA